MSYRRVIPRDLFNEANFLKCLGGVYIQLESQDWPHVSFEYDEESEKPFYVYQWQDDGSLVCDNIRLFVRGEFITLYRPLNSRQPWPLHFTDLEDIEGQVFNDDGTFHQEFIDFVTRPVL